MLAGVSPAGLVPHMRLGMRGRPPVLPGVRPPKRKPAAGRPRRVCRLSKRLLVRFPEGIALGIADGHDLRAFLSDVFVLMAMDFPAGLFSGPEVRFLAEVVRGLELDVHDTRRRQVSAAARLLPAHVVEAKELAERHGVDARSVALRLQDLSAAQSYALVRRLLVMSRPSPGPSPGGAGEGADRPSPAP